MTENIYFYYDKFTESLDLLPNRSLFFGEGVFETFRCKSQMPVYTVRHLQRLTKGSAYLQIPMPSDETIFLFIQKSVLESGLPDANVKICLFSSGGNGYYDKSETPLLCSVIKPYPYKKKDMRLCMANENINSKSELNQHKTINYIQNTLSKRQALNSGYEEALFINEREYVTECTAHNIFWIKENKIYTPATHNGLLPGITRSVVIDICNDLKLPLVEGDFKIDDIQNSDIIFLTNSISGLIRVSNFMEKTYLKDHEILAKIEDNLLTRLKW